MNYYCDAFSWILIGLILMLPRECHAWFCVSYGNTRPTNCKLTVMSTKRKWSVLLSKDKQTIFYVWRKEKKRQIWHLSLKSASSRSQIYAKTKRRSWNSRTSSRWAKHSIQSPWRLPMTSRLIKLCMPVFFSKDILECRFQVRFCKRKQNISLCS